MEPVQRAGPPGDFVGFLGQRIAKTMNEIDRIIDQIRRAYDGDAWHGLPLRAILADVPADVADARPIRDVHSIREIVKHIAFWYDGVRRRLGGEVVDASEVEQWPEAEGAGDEAWRRDLDDLERAHEALLEAVGRLGVEDLERPVPGNPYNAYVLLHGLVQHNLFHAGQVAILKKAARG
jgi:uncharacterized damage-inducible protein DinB